MDETGSATISADDLGWLVWCAINYDRRLPQGNIPPRIWEALSVKWRENINKWKNSDKDALGAQIRITGSDWRIV